MVKDRSKEFEQLLQLSKVMRLFCVSLTYKQKITPSQLYVMEMCDRLGQVPIKKVKESLLLSSQSLSRTLGKLQDRDIIERNFERGGDKRTIVLSLTPLGQEVFNSIKMSALETLTHEDFALDQEGIFDLLLSSTNFVKKLYDKSILPKT